MVRVNFFLPAELLERLRKFVPKRKYSKFVSEAIDEKLKREAKKRLLNCRHY
jgi:metal-responsive CopG/Arc/MetJ family transcriptional regulator